MGPIQEDMQATAAGLGRWRRAASALRLQTLASRFVRRRLASQKSPHPIVSFTFDDFPRSALRAAGEILREYGISGTYYTAMGLAGRRTLVGEMFERDDLDYLMSSGHELACHTLDHSLCSDLTAAQLLASCQENRRRIAAVSGSCPPSSFSFPEGVVTPASKAAAASVYLTCRTIEPGVNRDPVDLAFLRAYRIYSATGIQGLCKVILGNQHDNSWLILYTHDVANDHSAYGCTPQEFRETVRWAVASGAEILPVVEAAGRFQLEVSSQNRSQTQSYVRNRGE